jgi:hypothetical protein
MIAMDIDEKKRAFRGFLDSHPWLDHPDQRTVSGKDRDRAELDAQVQAFLANGGEIKTVCPKESHHAKQPIKRSRKEQVKYQKRIHRKPLERDT